MCRKSFILFFFASVFLVNSVWAEEYKGKVVSLVSATVNSGTDFSFYGDIEYVAPVGTLLRPQILDSNGKVLKEGTVFLRLNDAYWKAMLNGAIANMEALKQELKVAEDNYNRYETLSKTKAVSTKMYQDYQSVFYAARGEYNTAQADVLKARRVLYCCVHVAPFEGIVDKVMSVKGRASGNPATVRISQLNPIGIKVLMPRSVLNQIKSETPVRIFTSDGNNSQGIYYSQSIIREDGILFVTNNALKVSSNEKNVPEVEGRLPILKFDFNPKSKTLAVPLKALLKDAKGSYVWKSKDSSTMMANQGLKSVFQIEKVYVKLGGEQRLHGRFGKIGALASSGNLKENDTVVVVPATVVLKEGQSVSYPQPRYTFMPGDQVKVVVGE